jgi:hypothetical protein
MDDQTKRPDVLFDRLRVSVEEKGVRLCLEGIVPPELWPDPTAEAQPESRRRELLTQIGELFSELIPRPVLHHIAQLRSGQSGCPKLGHSPRDQQKSAVATASD